MKNFLYSAWFEKYRPKRIEDVVFNDVEHEKLVEKWVKDERVLGNILLSGSAGTGKTTLAEILIKTIIKAQNDLLRMKTRSVGEIDDVLKPWIKKRPVASNQKIIYIEEVDRISKQGQTQLKEDLLEKYQEHCIFICCTNYPRRIDNALLTRFTYKLEFNTTDINKVKNRLKFILDSEGAKYDENELLEFVEKNLQNGLRELINSLQKAFVVNNDKINFENIITSNLDENIIKLINGMINQIMNIDLDAYQKGLCINLPENSAISVEWSEFTKLLHNNININYDNIFDRLYCSTDYLPAKTIIGKYHENIETKMYPHIHLISCVYEVFKCIVEIVLSITTPTKN